MGFNYEVGADNMVHSYTHRVESMAALAFADGKWAARAANARVAREIYDGRNSP